MEIIKLKKGLFLIATLVMCASQIYAPAPKSPASQPQTEQVLKKGLVGNVFSKNMVSASSKKVAGLLFVALTVVTSPFWGPKLRDLFSGSGSTGSTGAENGSKKDGAQNPPQNPLPKPADTEKKDGVNNPPLPEKNNSQEPVQENVQNQQPILPQQQEGNKSNENPVEDNSAPNLSSQLQKPVQEGLSEEEKTPLQEVPDVPPVEDEDPQVKKIKNIQKKAESKAPFKKEDLEDLELEDLANLQKKLLQEEKIDPTKNTLAEAEEIKARNAARKKAALDPEFIKANTKKLFKELNNTKLSKDIESWTAEEVFQKIEEISNKIKASPKGKAQFPHHHISWNSFSSSFYSREDYATSPDSLQGVIGSNIFTWHRKITNKVRSTKNDVLDYNRKRLKEVYAAFDKAMKD